MQTAKLSDFIGGWFLGNFQPSLCQTPHVEVALKRHKAGEPWPMHGQQVATEYNLVVTGRLVLTNPQGEEQAFNDGDLFVIPPGEAWQPSFVGDCTVVCVKVPSVPGDKVCV